MESALYQKAVESFCTYLAARLCPSSAALQKHFTAGTNPQQGTKWERTGRGKDWEGGQGTGNYKGVQQRRKLTKRKPHVKGLKCVAHNISKGDVYLKL